MNMRIRCFWVLALHIPPIAAAGGAFFLPLGDLPSGPFYSEAGGISPDGSVVVGQSSVTNGALAFRSVIGQPMENLGDLPGGTIIWSIATGTSLFGEVVVGNANSNNGTEAFRWTRATGMVGLGDLPGNTFDSSASAVTPDGQTIAGYGISQEGREAMRWTASTGMVGLGDLPGGAPNSSAAAISDDGNTIVGQSSSQFGTEAFRWRPGEGMVGLGDLPGNSFLSRAHDVSADGNTIVGGSDDGGGGAVGTSAFRWTEQTGMVALGTTGAATGVSADGSTIVGLTGADAFGDAFIWDAVHGVRNFKTVLEAEFGLNLQGWILRKASGISPDGQVIFGSGIDPQGRRQAWVAGIPEPTTFASLLIGTYLIRRRAQKG